MPCARLQPTDDTIVLIHGDAISAANQHQEKIMKTRNLVLAAVLALGASSSAFAVTDANALRGDLGFSLSDSGNLNIVVNDGTATLYGYGHLIDIAKAKRLALNSEGIDRVINIATSIN
jgi:hypothetical protein